MPNFAQECLPIVVTRVEWSLKNEFKIIYFASPYTANFTNLPNTRDSVKCIHDTTIYKNLQSLTFKLSIYCNLPYA